MCLRTHCVIVWHKYNSCSKKTRSSITSQLKLFLLSIFLDAMEINELKQKFIVLMDHFHAAVEEIRALRNRLSKAQDTIDAMEIDKIRFEESFKRTIVMQEQQENLMSKRIQDLTNKLLVSEKAVRQLKERKHSRKHSLARQQATQSDSGAADA